MKGRFFPKTLNSSPNEVFGRSPEVDKPDLKLSLGNRKECPKSRFSPTARTSRSFLSIFPAVLSPYGHSTPRRKGHYAHIQLDILGADNLIPACKRAVKGADGYIADRKPTLKISLFLPANSSPTVHVELKRVFLHSVENCCGKSTLNPRWDKSVYIPIPTPKSLYSKAACLYTAGNTCLNSCRELLNWWGRGVIKIEVLDTERFNTDIHLGEVNLLMSSLSNPAASSLIQRLPESSPIDTDCQLQISGTYPLVKDQGSSRVSGSVTLHAYMHIPAFDKVQK
jgi:hypothetical protein